jgi:hypothetical protein
MKHARSRLPLLLCLVASVVGCTRTAPDIPTTELFEKTLTEQAVVQSNGRLRIGSIQKTNGVVREYKGAPAYAVEFSGKLSIVEDCIRLTGGATYPYTSGFFTQPADDGPAIQYRAGQQLDVTGFVLFEKTEQGWRWGETQVTDHS